MTQRKIVADDIRVLDLSASLAERVRRAGIDRVTVLRARVQEHGPTAGLAAIGDAETDQIAAALDADAAQRLEPTDPQFRRGVAGAILVREATKVSAAAGRGASTEEIDSLIDEVCAVVPREWPGLDQETRSALQREIRDKLMEIAEGIEPWQDN